MSKLKKTKISIKNKWLKTTLLASTLTTYPAYAEDWSQISNQNGVATYVDMDSYNEKGGLPFIDTKNVYKTAQTQVNQGKKLTFYKNVQTTQFNCTTHTYRVLKNQLFDKSGLVIYKEKSQSEFSFSEKNVFYKNLETLVCQVHRMVGE